MSTEAMRTELDATAGLPLEEAVPRIATALNGQTLLVPLVDYDEATGNVQLLTAKDNEGVAWIYAYTGEEVMQSLGMTGTRYGHFEFMDVVRMARRSGFGGIVLDMAEGRSRGIIPDYWLEEIERVLGGAE
jgi:SseB protein N-terminal domain